MLRDEGLRFKQLCAFDQAMIKWEDILGCLASSHQFTCLSHEEDKIIAYEKGPALFILNFHTHKSFEDYQVGTKWSSDHIIIFDSD